MIWSDNINVYSKYADCAVHRKYYSRSMYLLYTWVAFLVDATDAIQHWSNIRPTNSYIVTCSSVSRSFLFHDLYIYFFFLTWQPLPLSLKKPWHFYSIYNKIILLLEIYVI